MIQKLYGYFLLLFFLSVTSVMAQTTYPVQTNVNLLPPYSLYLSDYYSGTKEKIVVTLINRDQFKPTLSVRLRMIITAPGGIRIQTNENAFIEPITVETGSPLRLTQDDLAPYFQPNNLITQGYLAASRLPEGMVEFCFQAVEAFTGQVLSTSTCTRAWITSQKPPLLSLPRNTESIAFREPLNVLFQWTPLHQGLALVEYDFILKELWDNGMTPQAAFPYSPEIYRETTRSTSIIYGALQPPLLPGKRYAWVVQAKAREGLDEVNLFQNDGYSEIRWFNLQDNCAPPQVLTATAEKKRLNLEWNTLPEYIGFTISYRLKSAEVETQAEWKEQQTLEPKGIVYGLQNGGTYEYRVGGMCMTGQPVYTPVFTVTLPETDSARLAQCGIMPDVNLTNQEPIKELKTGEEFKASDFPITVVQITGSNGTFTGKGWTIIPWLNDAKIAVEFRDITINSDKQMINGYVEAMYDKTEGQIGNLDDVFEGGFDQGIVKTGLTKTDYKFDYSIPGVDAFELNESGELVITDSEGVAHSVTAEDKEGQGSEGNKVVVFPMTVQDKEGNVYQVEKVTETDASGKSTEVAKATYLGKISAPMAADSFDPKQLDGDKAIVKFEKGEGYYAFDTWQRYYDNISLIENKYEKLYTDYYAPWKFLPAGQSDKISATIAIKDQSIKPELVIFKTPTGTEYKAQRNGNTYTLQVTAGPAGDVQELYALYPKDSSKYYTLGKISIATYQPQVHKVVLVSVEGTVIDEGIEQKLKDVYGPVGITWQVQREQFAYSDSTRLMQNSTGLSTYNDAMRKLNNAYRAASANFDSEANYLFFLKATGNTDINNRELTGFMPRGAQFGYIFTSEIRNADEAQVVAHELGHGRWKLYHPFDKHYGGFKEAKKTENVMSYGNTANHLAKWQWDQINDPAMLVSVFEGDDRSASFANAPKDEKGISYLLDKPMNFVAMSGKVVPLPQGALIRFYCQDENANSSNGQLIGFKVNGVDYVAKYEEILYPTNYFSGFYKIQNDKYTAEVYANNTILQLGEQEISFLHAEKSGNSKELIKVITAKKTLSQKNIEGNGGKYAGWRRDFDFTYDFTVDVVDDNKLEYASSCEPSSAEIFPQIIVNGRYKITVEKTATGQWKATVKIDPAVKRNPKINEQQLAQMEAELSRMASEKLNEVGGPNGLPSTEVRMVAEDGGEFYARSMKGVEWLHTIGNLGSTIWETASLPKEYWNQDEKYSKSAIHVPPTFAGVSDGVIDELMSYPQLAKLGYDVATKEEVRQGLWSSVKNISPESIKNAAVQFYEEKKGNYTSDKFYIVRHTVGKDGVQVASMFLGVGGIKNAVKDLDEGVEKAGKEIVKDIDDALVKSVEGADGLAKKSLKEAIEKGDFESELVEGLKNEVNDVATKKGRKLSWEEVKVFFKRGNDFNRKGRLEYNYNEINLADGKRLDSYIPGKEIVSRKATTLSEIQPSTFEGYLKELTTKYQKGKIIRSDKYKSGSGAIDGQPLSGEYYLEIPLSNKSFYESNQTLQDLAKQYVVKVKFLEE